MFVGIELLSVLSFPFSGSTPLTLRHEDQSVMKHEAAESPVKLKQQSLESRSGL